jgi:hypothetical protein
VAVFCDICVFRFRFRNDRTLSLLCNRGSSVVLITSRIAQKGNYWISIGGMRMDFFFLHSVQNSYGPLPFGHGRWGGGVFCCCGTRLTTHVQGTIFSYFKILSLLLLYVLLSILYVLCFWVVLCIVSPHVYSCCFSICASLLTTATQFQLISTLSYFGASWSKLSCFVGMPTC